MSDNTNSNVAREIEVQEPPPAQPPPHRKCPRCDSGNTKFCYYNNYSFSQPRYFCKACRRYWTHGGALRNVPIGGGCRKNRRNRAGAGASAAGGSSEILAAGSSSLIQLMPAALPNFGGAGRIPPVGLRSVFPPIGDFVLPSGGMINPVMNFGGTGTAAQFGGNLLGFQPVNPPAETRVFRPADSGLLSLRLLNSWNNRLSAGSGGSGLAGNGAGRGLNWNGGNGSTGGGDPAAGSSFNAENFD